MLYLVPATFLGSKAVERRARLAGVRSRIHMPAMRYSMVSSCPVRPITSASIARQALSKACACTTTASVCLCVALQSCLTAKSFLFFLSMSVCGWGRHVMQSCSLYGAAPPHSLWVHVWLHAACQAKVQSAWRCTKQPLCVCVWLHMLWCTTASSMCMCGFRHFACRCISSASVT